MSEASKTTAGGEAADAPWTSRSAFESRYVTEPAKRGKRLVTWVTGVGFLGDALAIYGGLLLAFWIRFETPMRFLGHTASTMPLQSYNGHFVFLTITLLLLLFHFDLYSPVHTHRLRKVNAIILTSCSAFFLLNLGMSFQLNTQPIVSRLYLFGSFVSTLLSLVTWRWMLDRALTLPPIAAVLQRRILLVGWSEQSAKLVENVVNDPKHPYQIVGCVPSAHGMYEIDPPEALEKVGDYGDLKEVLNRHAIDIVIVADLNPTRGELLEMVSLCEKESVHLQIIPSCFQILLSGLHLETTSGVPVLGIFRLPLDSPWNQLLKRTLDIIGGLFGLLVSAPLIAIFGGLVYLESPGPIFYRQRRSGLNNRTFFIVKIRSMRVDAESNGAVGWSTREDPRRLRIGSFMRRWNLDELPQFWNVLKGEMSLVGPRPERPELIANFKDYIPHYNARHGIKPALPAGRR